MCTYICTSLNLHYIVTISSSSSSVKVTHKYYHIRIFQCVSVLHISMKRSFIRPSQPIQARSIKKMYISVSNCLICYFFFIFFFFVVVLICFLNKFQYFFKYSSWFLSKSCVIWKPAVVAIGSILNRHKFLD